LLDGRAVALMADMRHLVNNALVFAVFIASAVHGQVPPGPAYFSVYNVPTDGTNAPQQFVIKVLDPSIIQEARQALSAGDAESLHVIGTVVKSAAYYNSPWKFHLDPGSIGFFNVAAEVCDAATSYVDEHLTEVGEALLPDGVWCPWSSRLIAEIPAPPGAGQSLRVASAASDRESAISPGALISIYGTNLTDRTEQTTSAEPPLTLGGVVIDVQVAGQSAARAIPLLMVSPTQVNAILPADLATGPVSFSLRNANGTHFQAASYIEPVAPALFAVQKDKQGYAVATLLRVKADGSRSIEELVAADPSSGNLTPLPVSFGDVTDDLYVSLYGSGMAGVDSGNVSLSVAAEELPVLFSGAQGEVAGLYQINLALPHSLGSEPFADLRLIVKSANGYPVKANTVRILFK
jgi:uncharacterized protein (TIGR03437 family)